jgi:hypothetical protein
MRVKEIASGCVMSEPFPSDFMRDLALSLLETRMLSHSHVMKTPETYHDVAEAKKE